MYYGATFMEAQLCVGEEVIVVGGGNSAGQAAVFLAQTAKRVHMLVRSDGLAASMSRYLIRRIEENPAIVLRTQTEIIALEGDNHLERVRWRNRQAGSTRDTTTIRHVFLMTGAAPNTQWLDGCVVLDAKGFIKTGAELSQDELNDGALAARPRRPISSKRVCPACSRSATSGPAISSVWLQRSAKDPSPSPSFIRYSTNKGINMPPNASCPHIDVIKTVKQAKRHVCEECVKTGDEWVHLRTCQECGTTLCCDSSPNRHATRHAQASGHPVIASAEPGERWLYCYPHDAFAGLLKPARKFHYINQVRQQKAFAIDTPNSNGMPRHDEHRCTTRTPTN